MSNRLLSVSAGFSAFVLTLLGFLLLGTLGERVGASLVIGLFALIVVRSAAERPNSAQARAMAALRERLLAALRGDLSSPAPALLEREIPALAGAVDGLFAQVRSSLDDANALAMYDPVTALPNRIHFRCEAERILAARTSGSCALLFIDLDGFKEINDRLGHALGDQALALVANRLRVVLKAEVDSGVSSAPILARLAGDEFTIFLPGTGCEEAERIAGRALDALAEPFRAAGSAASLSGSIGIALAPDHGTALPELMKAADLAMYQAKAAGRSRFYTYAPALALAAAERSRREAGLRQALRNGSLELAFRTETCLRRAVLLGAEARICRRMDDASLRPLDAELDALDPDAGLAVELGEWKVEALARALARSDPAEPAQRLGIDIHPRQLGALDPILDRIDSVGAFICTPELALGEEAAMQLDPPGLARLAALHGQGVSLALDDFGRRGCGFARLRSLPLDRVKLDSSLSAGIDRSERDRDALAAIIHLVHGLGWTAIVKDISRPSQVEVLRAIGCDGAQGPFFGADLSEAEMLRQVRAAPKAAKRARA